MARRNSRVRGWCGVLLIAASWVSGVPVHATNADAHRPKIGVVLAGGGARGGAHIGVLKALEAAHVPIDYITGTSVGAIIAALYAVGYTPDEMEKFVAAINWNDALADRVPREDLSFRRKTDQDLALFEPGLGYSRGEFRFRNGLILGQNINLVLARISSAFPAQTDFDQFQVPFRAVATDIATGQRVVLKHGDLAQALRASMAVPGVFAPVLLNDQLLIDGGVADNLPIDVVREMGADIVIAVDVSAPLLSREHIRSPLDVTAQLTSVLTRRNVVEQIATLGQRDVLIVPDLHAFGSADFPRIIEMISAGQEATHAVQEQLAALALPPAAYAARLATRRSGIAPAPRITFYRIDNQSHIANSTLAGEMNLDALIGQPLLPEVIDKHFAVAYGTQRFETVSYETIKEGDAYGLKVIAREKSWGPNYVKLRVLTQGDLAGDNGVSLGVGYDVTDATKYSGEWRSFAQLGEERLLFTELYQPLGEATSWFLLPRLQYQKRKRGLFNERRDRLAQFDVFERTAELFLGREFGTVARIESGVRVGRFEADRRIGTGGPRSQQRSIGEWTTQFTRDTLDNRNFPSSGTRLRISHLAGRDWLGADANFDQLSASLDAAMSIDHTHIAARALYTRTTHGSAPIHRQATLGGFFRLSGVEADQLTGQHAAFVAVSVFQRFETPLISTFVGTTLEYGNVFQRENIDARDGLWSGSVWMGADTPLGPAYLGYGLLEGGTDTIFLSIGRPP